MKRDPIVNEVRMIRSEILKAYGWNFKAVSREVMRRQHKSGHKVISFGEKAIPPDVTPKCRFIAQIGISRNCQFLS